MNNLGGVENMGWMIPSMSIEYRTKGDILHGGTFDNVPENATGAYIYYGFPYVASNGEYLRTGKSYHLYVGQTFDIRELLKQIAASNFDSVLHSHPIIVQADKEKLLSYLQQDVRTVVYTLDGGAQGFPGSIKPVRPGDAVFATREEMVEAINKIYSTFKGTKFGVSFDPQEGEMTL